MGLFEFWRKSRALRIEMERLYWVWKRAGYEAQDMAVISFRDYHAAMERCVIARREYEAAKYAWQRFRDTA